MAVFFQQCDDFSVFKSWVDSRQQLFLTVHVNIRSIRKYWDLFNVMTKDVLAITDVFVLTETNISVDWCNQFALEGYNSFWFSRSATGGGGIVVFVKDTWLVTRREICFSHAETIALKIENSCLEVFLLACYRPPSQSVRSFLDELKNTLPEVNNRGLLCLVGDLNIDVMKQDRPEVCEYLNILANEGVECVINSPTREEIVVNKLVSSAIDHVCVKALNTTVMSSVITQKLADHYFIGCQFRTVADAMSDSDNKRVIEIVDNKILDRLISSYDWDSFRESVSKFDVYAKFAELIKSFTDLSKRTVTIRQRRSDHFWLNEQVLAAIKEKDYRWARSRRAPTNDELRSEFRVARNRANALLRSVKRQHFKGKFAKAGGSSAETWSLVNNLRGSNSKRSVDDVIKRSFGDNFTDITERFNSFFVSPTTLAQARVDPATVIENNETSAFLFPMNQDDLRSTLFSIKPSRSPGIDGITVGCLQRNFEHVKDAIIFMMNSFIELGVIPDQLKTAVVRPIFKGGDSKKIENYRPISILPVLGHVIEKHLFQIMNNFIDKCSLLSSRQYGFVSGRGTQLLLDDVADEVYSAFDGNMFSCAVFLDVSKAFDTVNHEVLLRKLFKFGFRGPFHSLLANLLDKRAQVVSVNKVNSSVQILKAGVPQGSVLSPLLFNIYVNDLESVAVGCRVFQYADDTLLVSRHVDFCKAVHILQSDVVNLMDWYSNNRIKVNPSKTKLICFRNPLKPGFSNVPFFLHGSGCKPCSCSPVPWVDSTKYMGLIFEYDMSWNKHMAHVCSVLRKVACMMYNVKILVPFNVKKMIVHALVYSLLRYGVTVHAHCTASWRDKIDSILKGILRSVAYNSAFSSSDDLFRDMRMPSLLHLFTETVVLRHFWNDSFKTPHKPVRLLRISPRFNVERSVTRYGKRMRRSYIPEIFNMFSDELFTITSKFKLKKYLRSYVTKS